MLGRGLAQDRPGIVHQNVDLGHVRLGLLDELVDCIAVGKIALIGPKCTAQCRDIPLDLAPGEFERCRDTDDVGPSFRQADCHRFADSALAAGDQGGLAGEIELILDTHESS